MCCGLVRNEEAGGGGDVTVLDAEDFIYGLVVDPSACGCVGSGAVVEDSVLVNL